MKINSALLPLLLQFILFFFILELNFNSDYDLVKEKFELTLEDHHRAFTSFVVTFPSFILFLLQNTIALKAKKNKNRVFYRLYATLSMFLFIGVSSHIFQANYGKSGQFELYTSYVVSTLVLTFVCIIWRYTGKINFKEFEEKKTKIG